MGDGMDLLMRPVLAKLCKYESLLDGSLTLGDIVKLNCALDIESENRYRLSKSGA